MKIKILIVLLIIAAVLFLVWWHFDGICEFFDTGISRETETSDKDKRKGTKDFSDAFLLKMGMSQAEAEEIILNEWNGVRNEEYTDVNTVSSAYTVDQVGKLGNQQCKIFTEYDSKGLYCIELFLMDGNEAAVDFLHEMLGDVFKETKTAAGEPYMAYLRADGIAFLYDQINRVIIYDTLRDNVWAQERNSEYKIK